MKKAYKVSSSALIAIGVIHTVFGIFSATEFTSEILWFISTGLLLIIVGCVNLIMAIQHISGFDLRVIQVFNLLGAFFITLLVIADPMELGFLALMAQLVNSFGAWMIVRKRINCCHKYDNNQLIS